MAGEPVGRVYSAATTNASFVNRGGLWMWRGETRCKVLGPGGGKGKGREAGLLRECVQCKAKRTFV